MSFPPVDCLIVGAGVVGLTLARELSGRGLSVRLIDQGAPGREASWAGAGMLPPAPTGGDFDAWTLLRGRGAAMQESLSRDLREATGVCDGYRRCGAWYLAYDETSAAEQNRTLSELAGGGVRVCDVAVDELPARESLARWEAAARRPVLAQLLPDEAQIRNPRRLAALIAACAQRGAELTSGVAALPPRGSGRLEALPTTQGPMSCGAVCFTAGAWTGELLAQCDAGRRRIHPIRGQVALLRWPSPRLSRIVNVGRRYLVPRSDGRLLVGSTEEDVGFCKSTTAAAIADLLRFAGDVCPAAGDAEVERTWAGLRPASFDGLPAMGRVESFENVFVAAGHFRAGLTASPAAAQVTAELICGEPLSLSLGAMDVAAGRDLIGHAT